VSGDTLVNAETGEIIAECTPDEARKILDRMHTGMGVVTELYIEAYTKRVWAALGHASWDAFITAEFGKYQLRLPSEERDEMVMSLRAAGLSIRAIAATGVASKNTVERTIAASGVPKEDTSTTGTDGKTYPAAETAGVRAARERREREAAEATEPVDYGTCTAGFGCAAQATGPDGMCSWHRGKSQADAAAKNSDTGPSHPPVSDAPDALPPDASGATTPRKAGAAPDAAATGVTERTGQPAPHADGAEGSGTEPSSAGPAAPIEPVLPDDWRNDVGHSTYLLRHPVAALRSALGPDERADLTALYIHLGEVLADPEQEQPA
jgi:hypothetical protein